jgi:hypothetical protein
VADIHSKIMTANRVYLLSKLLSGNTKLKIYKTLIRPVLSYGSGTWTLTIEEMNALRISARKIIRKIYGPIKGDSWRIRMNKEIKAILQGTDIVQFIKSSVIRWYGHVERMQNQIMPKKLQRIQYKEKRKTTQKMEGRG